MGIRPGNSTPTVRRNAKRPARIVSFTDARSKAGTSDLEKKRANRPSRAEQTRPSRSKRPSIQDERSRIGKRPSISDRPARDMRNPKDAETSEKQSQEAAPKSRLEKLREKAQEKRRARNKAKADAAFDRTYDESKASTAKATPESSAPRAALYEGKMGSSHKKASKLQATSKAKPVSGRHAKRATIADLTAPDPVSDKLHGALGTIGAIGSVAAKGTSSKISSLKSNPALYKVVVVLACVFFVLLMLYGPAQQYYCQMRETDRIEAEYAAVAARNATLSDSIRMLSTDEGIADKAHSDLGYVKRGEQTGVVSGLNIDDAKDFQGNVAPGSVPAPDTWYSPFLDIFFGYAFR